MILWLLLAGTACSVLCGCEKRTATNKERVEQATTPSRLENTPGPAATPAPAGETPLQQSPATSDVASAETMISLQQKFLSTSDPLERENIIEQLSDLDTNEAMDMIANLFQLEREDDLKVDMIETIEEMQVENTRKIPIFAAAIQSNQPPSVRIAGIDALTDLKEPAAIQLLQSLLHDPDTNIRNAAQEALQSPTATPP